MSALQAYQPKHDFLICIDSDGCAFDTMDIKHKECFCPAYIEHFGLQPVAGCARDAWEFSNLYSETRGIHRLKSLLLSMDLLAKRRDVAARGFTPPRLESLRAWMKDAPALNNAALAAAMGEDADMRRTLRWSEDVNARVQRMVHGVPPFPHVRESLSHASGYADIVVVSATATDALQREWQEHDLTQYTRLICGQDAGSKRDIIAALRPHYAPGRVLMVGDAIGDLDAAKDNQALFYPICPGQEAASWGSFLSALQQMQTGKYDQEQRVRHFLALLPKDPPWEEI